MGDADQYMLYDLDYDVFGSNLEGHCNRVPHASSFNTTHHTQHTILRE
jgi:hypothetical protein